MSPYFILNIGYLDINTTDPSTVEDITKRGHKIKAVANSIAAPVMILVDQATGISYAAALPDSKFCAALDKN